MEERETKNYSASYSSCLHSYYFFTMYERDTVTKKEFDVTLNEQQKQLILANACKCHKTKENFEEGSLLKNFLA